MVLRLTLLGVMVLLFGFGYAQNSRVRHAPLQNMIDYTAQFVHQRDTGSEPPVVPVETDKPEDDPLIRTLFKEFLVQYQQLASNQKSEAPLTTTAKPLEPDFNLFASAPVQSTFSNPPETASVPQRRRLSPRRKINTPLAARTRYSSVTSSTTPFSTLLNRVNSLHNDMVESTTAFPSLRHRFFGVETSKSKHTPSLAARIAKTTPAPQIVIEGLPLSTELPKSVPNFKIPSRLVAIPSKAPVTTSKVETNTRKKVVPEFDEDEFRRQAENAKYEFASDIDDEINGNLHQREEVRDGLAVKGRYSFSDGYFKRTIQYEADDKGYRVVKQEVEPLEGPQTNPDGHARVSSYVAGSAVNYQITKDDIAERNQKTVFQAQDDEDVIEEV